VELSPEVKNLFLQIYRFTGGKIREFYSVRGDIKLPAQDRLPDAEPPFFDHRSSIGRRLLEKPSRDQSLLWRGKCDHKRVERGGVIWMQVAFKDEGKNFSIWDLKESLMPILFAKKFARFFVSQRQKAKHGDIVPRHRSGLIRLSWAMRFRLIT